MSLKNNSNRIYDIKIILLGETGVGKTSLIKTYFDQPFNPSERPTLDGNITSKILEINNKKMRINIWDTMGHEKYRAITQQFFKGSNIVIFVFDITNRASFLDLGFWVNSVLEKLSKEEAIFGVIGNKIDLFTKSEIEATEAEEYAEKIGALFTEASAAKNPEGLKRFINILLERLVQTPTIIEKLGKIDEESNIHLENTPIKKKKKKCCNKSN